MKPTSRLRKTRPLNDLRVEIADALDTLLRERGPIPEDLRDLVIDLRNAADFLVSTAEAATKARSVFDENVVREFRLAVMMMLKTCGEVPSPMMPGGDRLALVPEDHVIRPARKARSAPA